MAEEAIYTLEKLEEIGGLKRRMNLSIRAEALDAEVRRRLARQQKKAKLPGFRPGRAPMQLIERKYGGEARSDASMELVRQGCNSALAEQELELATQVQLTEWNDQGQGQDLQAIAEFEVYPVFELTPLEKLEVESPKAQVEDGDVDKLLEDWQRQGTTYDPGEDEPRPAADGDRLKVKMQISSEASDQPQEQEIYVLVGGERFPEAVEKAFVGAVLDEEYQVKVEPADGPDAGAPTEYRFQVLEVAHPYVPSLEEMASTLEAEEGKSSVEVLKERARQSLDAQAQELSERQRRDAAFDALLEANISVPVPEGLIESERAALRESTATQLQMASDSFPDHLVDSIAEQAERRVRFSILLRGLVREHQLDVDEADVRALMESEASRYGERAEAFRNWAGSNADYQRQVRGRALEQSAVKLLLDKAKVTERAVPLAEMQQQ